MDGPEAFDLGMLYWCGSLHNPQLTTIVQAVTLVGDRKVLAAVVVLSLAGLFLAGRRREALGLALGALMVFVLEVGLKLVVARPRPDVAWRVGELPTSGSFPSGHAFGSMAVYLALALLVPMSRRLRPVAIVLAVLLALSVGMSRLYLGVHYPTDVFAGWAAGLACALLAWVVGRPAGSSGASGVA